MDAVFKSISLGLSSSSLEEPIPPSEGPFPELRRGTLFTGKFIPTYNLVVLGIITIVSAVHWYGHLSRWSRRRRRRLPRDRPFLVDDDTAQTAFDTAKDPLLTVDDISARSSSSGSSTVDEGVVPAKLYLDEQTPLLPRHEPRTPSTPMRITSLVNKLKAWLIYQPKPIPFFNKVLPSNGSTIVLSAFVALNLFYLLLNINFNIPELLVFADRSGLVFIINLPLLYLLGAKTQPLSILTGYSYESLNIFHRRLGEVMCLAALVHGLGMFGGWYTLLRYFGFTLHRFIFNQPVLTGIAALIVYETIYFTSLASFRQRWYELFLGLHIILQAAGLTLLFFHDRYCRIYVGTALAIFIIDRLVYRVGMKSTTTTAHITVLEDGYTLLLSTSLIHKQPSLLSSLLGCGIENGWQATDHVFLTAPTLARKHIIQAHPFTILSPAPTAPQPEDQLMLDLLIRAQDGFSADLLREAHLRKTLTIRLDGPYGSSHARDLLLDAPLAILVAGGSGIAVTWPLVHFLLSQRSSDLETRSGNQQHHQSIILIWVAHKTSHLSWLPSAAIADVEAQGVGVIIPPATDGNGRPDLGRLITELVTGKYRVAGRTAVVASGPDGMNRAVRNTCSRLVSGGRDVNVSIEKFGW
jgi:NAD(P)H-flavin reductase